MTSRQTITLCLAFWCMQLCAQIQYKVSWSSNEDLYTVSLLPSESWSNPQNTVSSAQISMVVPTGGFQVGNVNSLHGLWSNNTNVASPTENPEMDYFVFGLQGLTSEIPFVSGEEVALFTFENSGICTGAVELIDHDTDPFMPPNSQSVNIGNQITVLGAGPGINAYSGNLEIGGADCNQIGSPCDIEILEIISNSPSTCGLADGSIEIIADGDGQVLQYSIDGGDDWQPENIFLGLSAGDIFEIQVRDNAAICIIEGGILELEAPLAAAITFLEVLDTDCGGSDGSITIEATSEDGGTLEFSIDDGANWGLSSNFQNLLPAIYPTWVRNLNNNCEDKIGDLEVEEDCSSPSDDCLISFELEYLGNEKFQVSILTDTTWNFPANITSSGLITLKVPHGGFQVSNLENSISGVVFGVSSNYEAPMEAPEFDYISFGLNSFGTQNIPYVQGGKASLFTFENSGNCTGGFITLMDNETDPFFPPNSLSANVGQQLTVSGYGGADVPVCILNNIISDCGEVAMIRDTVYVSLESNVPMNLCLENFLQLTGDVGNTLICANGDAVNVVTEHGSKCVDLETPAVFQNADFACVIHCDNDDATLCDTTVIIMCPIPTVINDYSICEGEQVDLQVLGGESFQWSPITGLDDPNSATPLANPSETTSYQVEIEYEYGCTSTESVNVAVGEMPFINEILVNQLSDCGSTLASIEINASGSNLQYSIDGGENWLADPAFQNLNDGIYEVIVRNETSGCELTYGNNPINIQEILAPSVLTPIDGITSCGQNVQVSIEISEPVLSFSIAGSGDFANMDMDGPVAFFDAIPTTPTSTFSVEITTMSGCIVVEEFELELIAPPSADFTFPANLCQGTETEFMFTGTATENANLTWEVDGGNITFSSPATSMIPEATMVTVVWNETGQKNIILSVADGGCEDLMETQVSISNGGEISIDDVVNIPCMGDTTGAITFTTVGQGDFIFEILNTSFSGNLNSNEAITVSDLSQGIFELIITDQTTTCTSDTTFIIEQEEPFEVIAVANSPSACDVSDATICLEINGANAPYFITSDLGIAPTDPIQNAACIENLFDGVVNITIIDNNGCSLITTVELDTIIIPELAIDDIGIAHNDCPNGFEGSINSNTGIEYLVSNEFGMPIGNTPQENLESGNYLVTYTIGICSASEMITIDAPEAWSIDINSVPESCEGDDGSLILSVSGGIGDYDFDWSNGDSTLIVENLNSDSLYSVTITDSLGCNLIMEDLTVDDDCPETPCDDIFTLDTFYVFEYEEIIEICLPTSATDLSTNHLTLDEEEYIQPLGICTDSIHFYSYGMLINLGSPPYRLESWGYNGEQMTTFSFNSMEELVYEMNTKDPTGNWILNENEQSIKGGTDGNYGILKITHIDSNTTLSLQANLASTSYESILVSGLGSHLFVVEDDNGCRDSLVINVLENTITQTTIDTIYVEVPIEETEGVCFDIHELNSAPMSIENDCENAGTGAASLFFLNEYCLEITGIEIGNDQACIVLCDNEGNCDTTIVIINVVNRDLVIYTGFSPNEDGHNDVFTIKNIQYYPNNDLQIYNRWGNKVYTKKGYTNESGWKGEYGKKLLPDGTYYYMLSDGTGRSFNGFVHLRR